MKKITALALSGLLAASILSGCSKVDAPTDTDSASVDFAPDVTAIPTVAQPAEVIPEVVDVPLEASAEPTVAPDEPSAAPTDAPTLEPTPSPTPEGAADISNYTYQTMNDPSFGFVYTYPSSWVNVPGKYTACYREVVEGDDFPARVAVTKKTLAHTPKDSTVFSQFQSYAQYIYAEYDPATFEWGDPNTEDRFLGEKANSITYLAYSGDIEIKGYMVCASVGRTIYIFHFCASYEDYMVMEEMMRRMRDSVTILD